MSSTMRIPDEKLESYFTEFTQRFLKDGSPEAIDVEVLEHELGDQIVAAGARLIGVTYDRHSHALELELDSGDHRIYDPLEVWAVEEADGFLSSIQVVRPDGGREVVSVRRVGLRRLDN